MSAPTSSTGFSGRVLVLFGTQLFTTGLGVVNGLLTARLLGPAGKGDYYLVVLLPALVMVLIQLGLPQALGFYTARGQVLGIISRALVLVGCLASTALLVTYSLLPVLQETIARGPSTEALLLGLTAIPITLNATFMTGIVLGRQAVRWNMLANVAASIMSTSLILLLVGWFGLGLYGAIAAFLLSTLTQSLTFTLGARSVVAAVVEPTRSSFRELLRYGLSLYPGTLTSFFSYRLDVFIIAALLAEPSAPIGYYSMAVSMAEMVFFFPNAVATLFFPRIAGASREEADRSVGPVARVTLLITTLAAVAVIPASILLVNIVLPAFKESLPPLFILLPGVVALSVGNVAAGYVTGLGRTGLVSTINVTAFAINVTVNVLLIPLFGIRGAATASLVSYTLAAVAFTVVTSRLSGNPVSDIWLPRADDARFVLGKLAALGRRVAGGAAAGS